MLRKPGIIVTSADRDEEFTWESVGWYRESVRHTPRANQLMRRAIEAIGRAKDVPDAIKRLRAAGFSVVRKPSQPLRNPENCYAVVDYGHSKMGFRFAVQCLPDRPLQVPPGVQILVRGMTRQGARALADHLNGEEKRGRHVPRKPVVRLPRSNPRVLRKGARGAFFGVRRSNPTLAVMGANPPTAAGDDIEATWAMLSYRRPDDPEGKRVVREHEFKDGFVATPLHDGSILLRHPRGYNLWTRR